MFKNRYRIVTDAYLGFEAQVKMWWFPFMWFQMDVSNTHTTIDRAEAFVRGQTQRVVKEVQV